MCSPSVSMREIRDAVYIKVGRKDDVMCFNPSWRDLSLNVSRGDPGTKEPRPLMKTYNLSVIYFNIL